MIVRPEQEHYVELCRKSRRVPVCGELGVEHFPALRVYRDLFGGAADAFVFESGKGPDATARYTLLGASNGRVLTLQRDGTTLTESGRVVQTSGDPETGWQRLDFDAQVSSVDYLPHFWGGWVGCIGYEVAEWFEDLPPRKPDDLNLPEVCFMQVERLLVYDHKQKLLRIIVSQDNGAAAGPEHYRACVDAVRDLERRVRLILAEGNGGNGAAPHGSSRSGSGGEVRCNMTQAEYVARVQTAQAYIREGDIYQANIAQRFEIPHPGDALELFARLRRVNPAPFSGCLKFGDWAIVSSSPERLVKVTGSRIETRPIAGTRPRGGDREADRLLSSELLLNEKERAEHLMLVDLERNDLGRLCRTGSVRVTDLMFLEQYSHVSHIVSNIEGELHPGVSVRDILRAVFPGGTITGCPKVRCMEIINELEPHVRGPYSGSFGYIGFDPQMDLNILIRTILLKNGRAYFHAGAGIVADSQPEKEYQETLDKAAAMMEVLGGSAWQKQ